MESDETHGPRDSPLFVVGVLSLFITASTNRIGKSSRPCFQFRVRGCPTGFTCAAAITLVYGLVAFGQIVLRRIDGSEQRPAFLAK